MLFAARVLRPMPTVRLGNAMLNDVLAVGVAGAVVVVIATILGAVELLWKAVAAIAGP